MLAFPKQGDTFNGRYRLLELLGSGGLGSVFRAQQIDGDREMALKIFHNQADVDEEDFRKRFLREAKALGEMQHGGIVSVYHVGISDDGFAFIAMELLHGKSLRQVLVEEQKLSIKRSQDIILKLAAVLEHVHKRGVVHRDLKPENVLLVNTPDPDSVKLLDFGLARIEAEQKLTKTGAIVGTVNYLSPEQCTGARADIRSDVYALTVCFFELITGVTPYTGDSPVGVLYKHINASIPNLSSYKLEGYSTGLNQFIAKGLAKDPDKRFQNMSEFAGALKAVSEGQSVPTVGESNSRLLYVVSAVVLITALAAFLINAIFFSKPESKNVTEQIVISPKTEKHDRQLKLAKQDYERWVSRFENADKDNAKRYSAELLLRTNKLAFQYVNEKDYASAFEIYDKTIRLYKASKFNESGGDIERVRCSEIELSVHSGDLDRAEKYLNANDITHFEGSLADCDIKFLRSNVSTYRHRFADACSEYKLAISMPDVKEMVASRRIVDASTLSYLRKRSETLFRILLSQEITSDAERRPALELLNELAAACMSEDLAFSKQILNAADDLISQSNVSSAAFKKDVIQTKLLRHDLNEMLKSSVKS